MTSEGKSFSQEDYENSRREITGLRKRLLAAEQLIHAISEADGSDKSHGDSVKRLKKEIEERARAEAAALNMMEDVEAARAELEIIKNDLEDRVLERTRELQLEVEERKRLQKNAENNTARELVISAMLRLSKGHLSLNEYVKKLLDLITRDKILDAKLEGAVFLKNEKESGVLKMVCASEKFPAEEQKNCSKVPYGTCLCGKAAKDLCVIFADTNESSHTRSTGCHDHQHFCYPLKYENNLLGVLLLLLPAQYQKTQDDLSYLNHVGDTMSVCINSGMAKTVILEAKAEAEKANNAKTEFLSRMSHELRTPMNAILGFGQILELDAEQLNPSHAECIQRIMVSAKHLMELIDEVLDVSKVDSGAMDLDMRVVAFQEMVNKCVALILPQTTQAKIQLFVDLDPDLTVFADEKKLRQVILNLLINGVKYNKEQGSVHVSAQKTNEARVRLQVKDTGIGIPEGESASVFEPFSRVGQSASQVEGTGMGLTICKKLVELMGGTIGFESELGQGSEFWIELAEGESARQGSSSSLPDLTPPLAIKASETGTVLYIEDNEFNQELVERIIKSKTNYRIVVSDSAETGLEQARQLMPDLILMDLVLPGIDGFEAVTRLKKDPLTKNIPVLALSAHAMTQHIEKAKEYQFSDYITKPIEINSFVETLKKHLKDSGDSSSQTTK